MSIPKGWITAAALGKRLGVSRQRVHQLIRGGQIEPAPVKQMIGAATWVYFIDPEASVLPSGKKRGGRKLGSKNKPLDTMKGRR